MPRPLSNHAGVADCVREDPSIDRRTFLASTGAVVLALPLVVDAQQATKVPRIAFLTLGSPPPSGPRPVGTPHKNDCGNSATRRGGTSPLSTAGLRGR